MKYLILRKIACEKRLKIHFSIDELSSAGVSNTEQLKNRWKYL